MDFQDLWVKMGIYRENRGSGGAILTPNELALTFGVYTFMPNLVKMDKEMRQWELAHTDRHTDRQTDRETQTDFIICPMLYAIAMGQIIT